MGMTEITLHACDHLCDMTHVPETIDLGGRYKPNEPFLTCVAPCQDTCHSNRMELGQSLSPKLSSPASGG